MNKCAEGSENGYILYSDKTRSKDLISGKTPIGIVICSYPEGGGQAISLTPVYSGPWGASNDIPNIANKNNKEDAVLDIASCANTKAITAAGNESLYPAAWAIQKYSTAGTSPGEWCMPAAGVVAHMTSLFANADETWDNMRNPNKTLQLVGSSAQFDDMQSSTETTHAGSVWRSMDNVAHGGIGLTSSTMAGKNLNSDFWAVIEF